MIDARMTDPSYVDPELAELLKKGPTPGLGEESDIFQLRELLLARKRELTAANTGKGELPLIEKDIKIPMRDGAEIPIRIHRPKKDVEGGSPVFVLYHGGGYVLGGLDNELVLARQWVTDFGGIAVNVDYRLAPEHPFPTGPNDAYDALKWTAANMESLGGNAAKGFIVGGVSAGANFSAVVSHLYRDDKMSPPLTGIYLSVPSVLVDSEVPEKYKSQYLSRQQNENAPVLGGGALRMFRKHYKDDPASPLSSPFLFPTGHKNLPPTYFQVAGMDPLRDEGLIYEKVLREECGVPTKLDTYPGLPHGFWSWWPSADFSKRHLASCAEGMRWLLEKGKHQHTAVNGS